MVLKLDLENRTLTSPKDKLYLVRNTLFYTHNETRRSMLLKHAHPVSLAYFIQVDDANYPPRYRPNLREAFIERRFARRAYELGVKAVKNVEAYPVGPHWGYSTTGYLVTAQGYRTRSRKKISSRSGAHL